MEPVPLQEPAGVVVLPDEEVVRRVRAGDTRLYELLVRRHNRLVYRTVRAAGVDDAEAEDVMQQTYLSAFARLDQFRGEARFTTWLVAIALNEARGRVRRRTLHAVALERGDPLAPTPAPSPESEVDMRESVALLTRAVEALPAPYRTVFVLREVEGLATADAAAALGLSEDAVKTRLHRARVILRRRLAAELGRASGEVLAFHAPRCDRVVAAVLARLPGGAG